MIDRSHTPSPGPHWTYRIARVAVVVALLGATAGCTLSNLQSETGTPTAGVVVTVAPSSPIPPTRDAGLQAETRTVTPPTTATASAAVATGTTAPTHTVVTVPATATTGAPVNGPLPQDEAIVQVVERVGPAVVTVINKLDPQLNRGFSGEASGTGVIMDRSGLIVTNNHVVAGTSALQVIFADGRKTDATLVGTDVISDLAVLRVSGAVPAVAVLGDSTDLHPGQAVIAIGSALGDFQNTVTTGIISGLNRKLPGNNGITMENLIQTDAAINHGNSGGPLLNLHGEVIGINTAVVRSTGAGTDVAEGLGFAISVNTVKTITSELVSKGRVARPYLGVDSRPINRAIASYYDLRDENGVLDQGVVVVGVTANSPADTAGVRAGDVITAINGQALDETNTLANALTHFGISDSITLTVVRARQTQQLPVTLAERP
ncbi:MAG: trypsin-like peptidase domain-containing protein [Chloroflexota bacterium]|nr:trypsin-like peptidase domain-containing protein [Chloroflexota bacterium]